MIRFKKFVESGYYNFPYADLNYKPMVDLNADVRKVKGGYGVYADKFVKGKRVMTPGGKHQKVLKKVYKNKKDANVYMAAIMIAKGGG